MAKKKIKFTRPELKRQRDALERFTRYLPMLKLKQQQLQLMLRKINKELGELSAVSEEKRGKFNKYASVLADTTGINVKQLSECEEVKTEISNVAGVKIPVFKDVTFPAISYSLFATPAWVDSVLIDLREINKLQAELDIIQKQYGLLDRELTKIIQRVNLFEKVKIPETKESIRKIQIQLGDAMTAAVGRAKIAKSKLKQNGQKEPDIVEDDLLEVGAA